MTREEAIKYLIKPVATSTEIGEEKQKEFEAYDMAIEALKAEPKKTNGEVICELLKKYGVTTVKRVSTMDTLEYRSDGKRPNKLYNIEFTIKADVWEGENHDKRRSNTDAEDIATTFHGDEEYKNWIEALFLCNQSNCNEVGKMTRRERLEAVINGEITEELIEECKLELEKLDARGAVALAKSKETEQYRENKVYEGRVCEFLMGLEEPVQVGEILTNVAPELTRQRMTAICTNLVREGRIRAVEVKVKGKGKRRAYIV